MLLDYILNIRSPQFYISLVLLIVQNGFVGRLSPPKELSSIITRLFPIGLPMPGGPISFSATLAPHGKDEPDEKYDKYYSHIICFLLLTSISVTPPSRISAESAGQNISLYHSIGRRYADVVHSSACRCCRSPLSSLLRSHAVLSLP